MKDKIYIVAGNLKEATDFRRQKIEQMLNDGHTSLTLSHFIIVDRVDQLSGLSEVHGFFYGSFREREDIRDIVRRIRIINKIPEGQMIIPDLFVGRGLDTPYENIWVAP